MTTSTFSGVTDTINEHTVAAGVNTVTAVIEGEFVNTKIRLQFRKNKGDSGVGFGFDDKDGVIIGAGVRLVNVVPGMIIWPIADAGGKNVNGRNVSVEILDAA